MSFPYWPGVQIGGGSAPPAAPQTLAYTAGTNTLAISGGNSVVITPTNLSLPGTLGVTGNTTLTGTLGVTGLTSLVDANISGTLQTGGGNVAIINGGFTSSQPSVITRPAGNDAVLQIQNNAGNGVSIITQDFTGITTISAVSGGAIVPLSQRLSITAAGTVVIPFNNIVLSSSTLKPLRGADTSVGATPGTITATCPTSGALQAVSANFTVVVGDIYRYTIVNLNTSTSASTGTITLGIYDANTFALQQTVWTRQLSFIAANADANSCSGIFQSASAVVQFFVSTQGANQPATITLSEGAGGGPTFLFIIERLGNLTGP